jgi:uncharacterized protein YfaS (alpha-2-macroglobulin family)
MKTLTRTILLAASILLIAILPGCSKFGRSKGQSTEFATFIKAYTSGIISDKATIKVELTSDAPDVTAGADVKSGVLTFSPYIKGTARWLTPKVIEFIPENGALKSGQAYKANLRLDKIRKLSSRKYRKFSFSFMVAIKEAVMSLDNMTVTAASPDVASVEGSISLTEELPLDKVKEMIEFSYPDNSAELNVTVANDPTHFHFEILNLKRGKDDRTLKLNMKPADTGFVTDSKYEVSIPASGIFKVMAAERVDVSEHYIDVFFSEALAGASDYTGLIALDNAKGYTLQIENNHVRVFFEGAEDSSVILYISRNLKSNAGVQLNKAYSKDFAPTQEKPAVELSINGSILPNSKELLLPFKAVNLNAVDISVIQIYEDNVLNFLQDNDLEGSNSLRRYGRLIYKRCLRLDSDPSKNLHKWQDFSVDLSRLFKQEAGAIYRIRLSFKKEYSLYGKIDDFKSGMPQNNMVDISTVSLTEEDDAEWDKPYPYYYEDFFDWNEYNWKDQDNPEKPSYYMVESRFPAINLLSSNLGIIAEYSGGDRIWVSVSDILTAKPVFNSELYVYSYQLNEIGNAKTGTDGMAEIKLSAKPFVVVAKRSGATSYLKVTEGTERSTSRFDVGGKTLEKGLKAFIYGERGVWRPGDTLHISMILQDKDNNIPDSHPVVMELYNPQGQFYNKIVNSEGVNGFYIFDIPTRQEDPTGLWNAYFKVGGATFHKSLRIESIKPNRLKIATKIGDGKTIDGGQKVPISIDASWLTGPAAAGLDAKVTMTLRSVGTSFEGFSDYTFTNPYSNFTRSEHELISKPLDREGHLVATVEMPAAQDAPRMLSANILTTVEEPGGNTSFSSSTMNFSPYSSYVGMKFPKSKSHYLETDKDYSIGVAVVDRNGNRISGENIEYSVYKMKWSWWWESREEEFDSYVNGSNAKPVASGTITSSANGDVSIPFRIDYPDWGRYLVVAKDEASGHVSGDYLYVDWPESRGRSSKTDPTALTMLTFSTDKEKYDVGETALVYIPGASAGQTLVSIENSTTVLAREWVKNSSDGVTYKIDVKPEMAPNCYVHLTMVQPHERGDNDLPIRLYGVKPIFVNNPASHLEPVITMPDVLRPEEEFTMKVSEKNHKAMTYTIAIVDEGLLDLTSFKTPDPWNAMYEKEALGVKTWDLYDDVIGAYSGRFSPMFSIGGDESLLAGSRKDNRFNPVVKFLGPFTLQSGTATHKIRLPMYVGSVRVMIIAGKDGAYGNAEKTVPVKSPLMVVSTLPRTLSTGEKVILPVNVFALENDVKDVTVSIKAEGPVKIEGNSQSNIKFSSTGDQLARFQLATTGIGEAKINVSASGNGHKASETITINVGNPNPATISSTTIALDGGAGSTMSFTPFKPSEDEWAVLELSSMPNLDYKGIYSFFKHYEYDCTEQLASKGISLLGIREHLDEQSRLDSDETIKDVILKLYSRQLADGGFAYWPGYSESDGWVSSMAGIFLTEASQNGFAVSKGVLASWARYLKKAVQNYRAENMNDYSDLSQAYRLYALALTGQPESGAMNRLKEKEKLSNTAAWMLSAAYSLSGKKNIAQEIIRRIQNETESRSGYDWTYGSGIRNKAISVEALALADDIQEAYEVAQEVSKGMSGYYSTQEAAFAAHAMAQLARRANAGNLSVEIAQGNGSPETVGGTSGYYEKELDAQSGTVRLKNLSESKTFATLVTSTYPADNEKVQAKSSGLSISVRYVSEDGKILEPAEILQGTEFISVVTVTNVSGNTDCYNVALSEKIPSGWEIFNDRLMGNSPSEESVSWSYRDIRDDRVNWFFNIGKGATKTFKIKLQAAYEGEFNLPAIKCEAMYDRNFSANTASGTAKVIRK